MPRVCVLGPVRSIAAGGHAVDPPSRSQRRLLAVLAVHAGHTMRAELLAELLGVSPGALRTTVSRLRTLTGPHALHTDPMGYRLDAETDAHLFARLVTAASGEPGPIRLGRLAEALALWHGPALDEFAHEAWAVPEVARLEELYAVAIEQRAEVLIGAERYGEAIAELEPHVAEHPLRDRPHGLLMTALAADGRQAEALRAFQRYRAHLAEAVGTEPSQEVRAIERRIAAGEIGGTGREPSVAKLPAFRSSLHGRERDVVAVVEHLRSGAVVTLCGEAGVGKTRLAVRVAAETSTEFESVYYVELASIGDGADVLAAIAVAVADRVVSIATLAGLLSRRRTLLVVDNCEHVLDAAAGVLDELCRTCPELTVLTTSREALALAGEVVVRVRPLDPRGAAADLFEERAADAGASVLPEHRTVVETICRRLDGNPLAIEVAATRTAALGLEMVHDSLDDRVAVLSATRRGTPERHRTLRAAIDWSYQLLDNDDQLLFRSLGVFWGGSELDAVEHVATRLGWRGRRILHRLGSIADRNMLTVETDAGATRFRLLETMRAFALDELTTRGELERAADAHADWVAGITDLPIDEWMTSESNRRCLRLERDVDNWRVAIAHAARRCDVELARRLSGPPAALLVWGRPDLAGVMASLDDVLPPGDRRRACTALGSWGPAFAAVDMDGMRRAQQLIEAIDPTDTSGAWAVLTSAQLLLAGEVPAAIELRTRSVTTPITAPDARDYNAALALYLACSSDARHLLPDDWLDRVIRISERSDVPVNRLIARIGVAWALTEDDPDGASTWVRAALDAHDAMPAFHRDLVDSFLGRLLIQRAPRQAAARLHELLAARRRDGSVPDTVALVIAAGLLARCEHPAADDVVATLGRGSAARYLAGLVPDVAERQGRGSILEHGELARRVQCALEQIVSAGAAP